MSGALDLGAWFRKGRALVISHSDAVRALVAIEPSAADDGPSIAGWLRRMCRAAARDLSAVGVGVSLVAAEGDILTASVSGPACALVEELQFALGEGPSITAFASRSPVLVPDLGAAAATIWPWYAPAAHAHGVGAVFAFPMGVGFARLGTLNVYRAEPGEMPRTAVTRALTYTEVSVQVILDAQERCVDLAAVLADGATMRFEVHQAQGMVMAELNICATEALARLRAYAFSVDRRLADVADDILCRGLVMEV